MILNKRGQLFINPALFSDSARSARGAWQSLRPPDYITAKTKQFRTFTIILAIHWKFCPIWQWLNLESIHWAIHYIIKAAHWDHYIIRLLYLYINLSCRFGVWGNGIDCCGILPKANCWGASVSCGLGCCMFVVGVLTEGGMVWAASWNCCSIPVHCLTNSQV